MRPSLNTSILALIASLIVVWPGCPHVSQSNATASTDLESERYAVISAVIRGMYVDSHTKLLVVAGADPCPPANRDESADPKTNDLRRQMEKYAFKNMPTLTRETINDFHARENDCFQLTRNMNIPTAYVLVTEKELEPLFPKGEFDRFWTRFYAKYPDSSGVISFSNPGFNRSLTQALVSTGRSCGGLCGAGHFVLLRKTRSGWRIQTKVETWVS